jgi:hypothetical protein
LNRLESGLNGNGGRAWTLHPENDGTSFSKPEHYCILLNNVQMAIGAIAPNNKHSRRCQKTEKREG